MTRPKVLLADDHFLVAQALATYLQDQCDLVGIVQDGEALVNSVLCQQPDLVISDLSMPVLSGLEAMRRLRDQKNMVRFIFLTMHHTSTLVATVMRAGASGFVFKNAAGEELRTAVEQVLKGRVYLPAEVAQEVMAMLASNESPDRLSPRQREVLRLLAEGLSVKEIAAELKLSPRTVESHKYEMMEELGVRSIAQLVHYAIRAGICASEPSFAP